MSTPQSAPQCFPFQFPAPSRFLNVISSWLRHILLRLPVTSIILSIFPGIMCFIRQFPRKIWAIHLALLLFHACRMFLSSLTFCKTSSFFTQQVQRDLHSSPASHFKILTVFIYFPMCPICSTTKKVRSKSSISLLSSNLLIKRVFSFLNAVFFMEILDFISRVHLSSFVIRLHKGLKHFPFPGSYWSIITCT